MLCISTGETQRRCHAAQAQFWQSIQLDCLRQHCHLFRHQSLVSDRAAHWLQFLPHCLYTGGVQCHLNGKFYSVHTEWYVVLSKRCPAASTDLRVGGNIIVDVIYVVAIEIYIRRVSLKSRDRFAVRTVLLLMLTATVCCAAKIGDFKGALTSQDITWAVVPPSELSVAEMNLALCAACLPSVRLVLGRYFPRSLCFWRREKKASGDTTWGFTQNVTHKSAVCKPSGTMPSMRSMHRAGDDDDDADCVMKFYGPEDKDNLEAVESEIEAGKISKAMTYRISESYNE